MRQIGNLSDEDATKRLVAFLMTKEIKTVADRDKNGWAIWIKEEDDLVQAKELFAEFQKNPADDKYVEAVQRANELVQQATERQERNRQNVIVMRGRWSQPTSYRKPLVVTMMIITVAVFMMTNGWKFGNFGNSHLQPDRTMVFDALLFIDPDIALAKTQKFVNERLGQVAEQPTNVSDDPAQKLADNAKRVEENRAIFVEAQNSWSIKLTNVGQGHFWRVFTPMFIHFGLVHILFNMMWLNALGGQIEHVYGTARFGIFVLAAAAFTNLLQCLMPIEYQGTSAISMCGGMSGVNYALAGFLWMKTLYSPKKGLYLSPINMYMLIIWMFIGIFDGGKTISMANWAHGGGLVFGLAVGYFPELFKANSKSD